jgi:hypothetical protein
MIVTRILELLVGGLTLGLPLWFAFLDRGVFPRLKWVEEGEGPPAWGRMVVWVGAGLAVLIALSSPISGFHPTH